MACRKQFKGIAGNLVQWCLSRNYWAIGQFYAHADASGVDEIVINLVDQFVPVGVEGIKFSAAIKLLSDVLQQNIECNVILEEWLQDASVVFKFDTEYQHKYHYWG